MEVSARVERNSNRVRRHDFAVFGIMLVGCYVPNPAYNSSVEKPPTDTAPDVHQTDSGAPCTPDGLRDGTCKQTSCQPGFDDCNGSTSGCDTNLGTIANCGRCGNTCSGQTPFCDTNSGTCVNGCTGNQTRCGESCTDANNDEGNCGRCGNECNTNQATASCQDGLCSIVSCVPGWNDCDRVASNGCETQLNTLMNCGGCGVTCSSSNGTASCASGTCTTASCQPGHLDIDSNVINGCEAFCIGGCAGTCNIDCTTMDCKCQDGCPCALKCGEPCKSECNKTSYCRVDARGRNLVEQVICKDDAVCFADLSGSKLAPMNLCQDRSVCDINCENTGRCATKCENNARCLVRCAGSADCKFTKCDAGAMTCAGGIIVCNRPCPP